MRRQTLRSNLNSQTIAKEIKKRKQIKRINILLDNNIIEFVVKLDPIEVQLFDEKLYEILSLKYQPQELYFLIDQKYKQLTKIKAFGLEIQSKETVIAINQFIEW